MPATKVKGHTSNTAEKNARIVKLMKILEIEGFCVSSQAVYIPPDDTLFPTRELMIQVDSMGDGAMCYLAAREFNWGRKRRYLLELAKLVNADV